MKRKSRSGQILIFGAIIIMLLVLSTAIAIQSSSTTYQSLRYTEVKELIGNVKEDFQRALGNILSQVTQEYNQTPNKETPMAHALGNITFWMKTTMRTLASKGVQINFTVNQESLQLNWYSVLTTGISSISAGYTMNIPALGFYGWKEDALILLNMTISIFNDNNLGTGINVMVNREGDVPVDNLPLNNFQVQYFNLSSQNWEVSTDKIMFNNGGGNYTIYVGSLGSSSKCIIVKAQDTRGIIVECFYSSPIIQTNLSATQISLGQWVYDNATITFPGFLIPLFYDVPNGTITFWVREGLGGAWIQHGSAVIANWDNNTQQLYAQSLPWTPLKKGDYYFNATYSGNIIYPSSSSDITSNETLRVN